eukprot:scaffold2397_cov113-Isochrysis_galbana.AAC.3
MGVRHVRTREKPDHQNVTDSGRDGRTPVAQGGGVQDQVAGGAAQHPALVPCRGAELYNPGEQRRVSVHSEARLTGGGVVLNHAGRRAPQLMRRKVRVREGARRRRQELCFELEVEPGRGVRELADRLESGGVGRVGGDGGSAAPRGRALRLVDHRTAGLSGEERRTRDPRRVAPSKRVRRRGVHWGAGSAVVRCKLKRLPGGRAEAGAACARGRRLVLKVEEERLAAPALIAVELFVLAHRRGRVADHCLRATAMA